MSVHILELYINNCKELGSKPNWQDLKRYKSIFKIN